MTLTAIIAPLLHDKWKKIEFRSRENLSIAYPAAYLESRGYPVDLVNAHEKRWSNENIVDYLKAQHYQLLGVSCTSQKLYPNAKDLVERLRAAFPNSHITMGGIFPSIEYRNVLDDIPELDTVVLGEGEIPLYLLAERLSQDVARIREIPGLAFRERTGVRFNAPERITDLSELPFPKRDPIDFTRAQEKFLRVLAGRGCPNRCAFCSIRRCYGQSAKLYRSPDNVVDELEFLSRKYGISYFTFFDDVFYTRNEAGRKWVAGFAAELRRRNLEITFRIELRADDVAEPEIGVLHQVGLRSVYLGVESGVTRLLREIRKGITPEQSIQAVSLLRKYDIEILLGYITLIPTMSYDELKENYRFLYRIGCFAEANLYNKLNVYNGCEYEEILAGQNLLLPKKYFYERHNYRYRDGRVAAFARIVYEVRTQLIPVKEMMNEIRYYAIGRNRQDDFLEIERRRTESWVRIIRDIFETIDSKSAPSSGQIPQRLRRRVDKLQRETEQALSTWRNLRVSA